MRHKTQVNLEDRIKLVYENLVLFAHAQKPHLNAHADESREAMGLTFGLSIPLRPYFMYARNKGFGETVRM